MLYLEDYLEMIEHLPQELRDRLTEMREMDLQVQNSADSLEKRVRTFFGNAKKMKLQEKETEYDSIKKDYYKTLEDADEKVQLANQMYDLVARYVRRLEQETHNFKLELEADHMGITEILEKRSQELDSPPMPNSGNSSQKENRYSITSSRTTHQEKRRDSTSSNEHSSNKRLAATMEKILPDMRLPAAVGPVLLGGAQTPTAPNAPTVNYTLGHISAGGTAIAAAASQAIAATQQMQQGRRTASLKASYEAIHSAASSNGGSGGGSAASGSSSGSGGHGSHVPHEISISKEIAGAAQTAIAAIQDTHKKHKKKNNSLASGTSSPVVASPVASLQVQQPLSPSDSSEKNSETYDPNEPRYCVCNEVAFGGMVACDNKKCPFEWYHYPCVGITEAPKGKWYCQLCSNSSTIKKRGARKTMSQC